MKLSRIEIWQQLDNKNRINNAFTKNIHTQICSVYQITFYYSSQLLISNNHIILFAIQYFNQKKNKIRKIKHNKHITLTKITFNEKKNKKS
jgi:hypothetical protein